VPTANIVSPIILSLRLKDLANEMEPSHKPTGIVS
jgi:hypothetical protein